MADEEPLLTSPPTQDVAVHVARLRALHQAAEMGRGHLPVIGCLIVSSRSCK